MRTTDSDDRFVITNDIAYLWVLAAYMGVWIWAWAGAGSPEPTASLNTGAIIALATALAWGFGPKAVEAVTKLRGNNDGDGIQEERR